METPAIRARHANHGACRIGRNLDHRFDVNPLMGVLSYLTSLGGRDLAVDLGTANTVVYVRGRGVVLSEPSIVALHPETDRVEAVGQDAVALLASGDGRHHAVRPLRDGADPGYEVTARMLTSFIGRVHGSDFAHPRVAVCVPTDVTELERRSVEDACLATGASEVRLIERPMAAAIGAGLPVSEPVTSMVADIGAGSTEIAVISLGGIVVSGSVHVGGAAFDEAIATFCRQGHDLEITPATAEEIKLEATSAGANPSELRIEVRGFNGASGEPATAVLSAADVRNALESPLSQLADAVRETLERVPPKLHADIIDRGITLAGGGSLLQGLPQRLRNDCHLPVLVAESPLTCVAVGAGVSLDEFETSNRAAKTPGPARRRAA